MVELFLSLFYGTHWKVSSFQFFGYLHLFTAFQLPLCRAWKTHLHLLVWNDRFVLFAA